MNHVGKRIQHLREQRGMTQQQLADLVDSHQTRISHVELGKRGVSLDFAVKLANALGVNVSELVDSQDKVAI